MAMTHRMPRETWYSWCIYNDPQGLDPEMLDDPNRIGEGGELHY